MLSDITYQQSLWWRRKGENTISPYLTFLHSPCHHSLVSCVWVPTRPTLPLFSSNLISLFHTVICVFLSAVNFFPSTLVTLCYKLPSLAGSFFQFWHFFFFFWMFVFRHFKDAHFVHEVIVMPLVGSGGSPVISPSLFFWSIIKHILMRPLWLINWAFALTKTQTGEERKDEIKWRSDDRADSSIKNQRICQILRNSCVAAVVRGWVNRTGLKVSAFTSLRDKSQDCCIMRPTKI